jgi:hypothetical protein
MIPKKSLTIFMLIILLLSFSGCKLGKENTYFKFVGFSYYIPKELVPKDPVVIGNQVYFLEYLTDNIFIASISNYSNKEGIYDLCLLGSYFPKTILRSPTSMCSDENNTLFVLETGDKVDKQVGYTPKLKLLNPSYHSYQFPVHIKAIYSSGEIKEISNLHLKLKELKQIKEAVKIGYCHGYLVIMFDNLNSLLFLEKTSLEKNILSYFMLDLPGRPIDFDTSNDSFVVLLDDFTLLKYEYNPVSDNFTIKTQIKVKNLQTNNFLFTFSESKNTVVVYDRKNEKIHIIKNNQQITIKFKGIQNIFKIKVNGVERIVVIRKETGIENYSIYELR